MANRVGEIEYTVKLNTQEFEAKADDVKDEIEEMGEESDKTGSRFSSLGKVGKVAGAAIASAMAGATAGLVAMTKKSIDSYKDYEQLVGGMEKIFDQVDTNAILADAQNAWKTLNISANDYMNNIAGVGSVFAQTMGDQKGYDTAKMGMQALADYASGTGKSVDLLMEKYQAISRSTSSYLSIADQFAGILPQTTDGFLKEAQQAGFLSDQYKKLTDVPVAEYQEALTNMLDKGVGSMGLLGNTAMETDKTLSGSMNGMKSAWENMLNGFADPNADMGSLFDDLLESAKNVGKNLLPIIEKAVQGIAQFVEQSAPVIAQALPKLIETLLPSVISMTTAILEGLIQALPTILQALIRALPAIIGALLQLAGLIIAKLPEIVGGILSALFSVVSEWAGGFFTDIGEWLNSVFEHIGEWLGSLGDKIGEVFSNVWSKLKEGAKKAWEGVKSIFSGLANFFKSIFTNAWTAVKNVFSVGGKIFTGIKDGIVNAFKAIVNAIIRGINKVVAVPFNAINFALDKIRGIDIAGIKPFDWIGKIDVPQIPELATGGIVQARQGGTLIRAGEAGEDEWVVPESKMASLMNQLNGAGGITINVSGIYATSESQKREVALDIWKKIQEINKSRMGAMNI